MATRWVIGTMTGTSLDALDASLVRIEGEGVAMRVTLDRHATTDLGPLRPRLRAACDGTPMSARDFAALALDFGRLHADAIGRLAGTRRLDLVAVHGQTVTHAPPCSWQLVNPWPIALAARCAVASDLRGADLAAGGEGAPITPLADFILFGGSRDRIVMNLGGFINATAVPARSEGVGAIRGFDACACNHLLDRVARARLGAGFDRDGAAAARGSCDHAIAQSISRAIAPETPHGAPRRSLGTGDEAARLVERTATLAADDACRTVVEAIADAAMRVIEAEVPGPCRPLLIAGGSARNRALQAALARRSGTEVRTTDESHGVPVHMREPAEIAILGALADDGVRYSLPQVTGAASAVPESTLLEAGIPAENGQV